MKQKIFSKTELETHALVAKSGWHVTPKATQLSKTYVVGDFIASMMLLAKVAVQAEVMHHYPEVEVSFGKLKVKLSTPALKGVSKSDIELALKIDEAYARLVLRGKQR